ncbi:hypothetical protein QBC35DRAFT_159478 [Podospora australis]|uniref:Zn(2)-C6 fungal-type domain-containing protein n=1 Tax=Podospora australis TaxID=1536484 RepID=A0AAN6X2Q0_9PEZI|nr:hypothetical protein QBC35DRAFT_159478 [Podospora australis]
MSAVSPTGQGPLVSGPSSASLSPRTVSDIEPKNVTFHLVFGNEGRARLPMRIHIFPHDTTDSIVCTVKNFYGLYSSPTVSKGVSFEDERGNLLIARYENFQRDMNIYVRVHEEIQPPAPHTYHSSASRGYYGSESLPLPSTLPYDPHYGHGSHGIPYARSPSPNNGGRGRRSGSVGASNSGGKKGRSRSSKNRSQINGHDGHGDSFNGYSSGDGALSTSSGIKKENLGNMEISLENIVEGGRRKRPKFESSELPLFAPPQMPAATSNPSVSPARRAELHENHAMPYLSTAPNPFSNPRPTQSPHSYNNGFVHPGIYPTPGSDARRGRGSFGFPQPSGAGMPFQTPTATANSCMSEEDKDVAIQLMRLGEFSHGRASASTMDDTFSGKADAASSTGATSEAESEHELPPARRQKTDASGNHRKVLQTTESHFVANTDGAGEGAEDDDYSDGNDRSSTAAPKPKATKLKANTLNGAKPRSQSAGKPKTKVNTKPKAKKPAATLPSLSLITTPAPMGPISPASLPASRKQSVVSNSAFSAQLGDDEQPDLSTKPRCQRCRKSKKGCDRQRPCARCKDAGIPADQCISEDEGNGRKGRYGRHMGVPVSEVMAPPAPVFHASTVAPGVAMDASDGMAGALDKNKKRKR